MSFPAVSIVLDKGGRGPNTRILVDNQDVTRFCKGFTLEADAMSLPVFTLRMFTTTTTVEADKAVVTRITPPLNTLARDVKERARVWILRTRASWRNHKREMGADAIRTS